VILAWWYDWMSFAPPFFPSALGHRKEWKEIPSGWVNYEDGLKLRSLEQQKDMRAADILGR